MKTVRVHEFGDLNNVVVDEVPEPDVGTDQVAIEIDKVALNAVDAKMIVHGGPEAPMGVGYDFVGTIVEVGPDVEGYAEGDRVLGMMDMGHAGSVAERVVVSTANIARLPAGLSPEQAAGLPLAGLTAWQALDALNVGEGDSILIQAGAGGVGHLAIQLAAMRGIRVCATASGEHLDILRECGAEHAIDYRSSNVADEVPELDGILDLLGGEIAHDLLQTLRPGGSLVSLVGYEQRPDDRTDVTVKQMMVHPDSEQLEQLAALAARGELRVIVNEVKPVSELVAELDGQLQGHTVGKRVIQVG